MAVRGALMALLLFSPALPGCAPAKPDPQAQIRHIMAPTGSLRVALYKGTPTSVLSETDRRGVGYDLGQEMARRLNVPFVPIIHENNAQVQATMKAMKADLAFANPNADRMKDMDFTQSHLQIELGYLAAPKSKAVSIDEVDRPGVRVGVTAGSSSLVALTRDFKNAKVVTAPTFDAGLDMLAKGDLDFYATNKANLGAMADKLPGSRILDGSWGIERHAVALPKGREAALPFARSFVDDVVATGKVKAAAERANLRGRLEEKTAP